MHAPEDLQAQSGVHGERGARRRRNLELELVSRYHSNRVALLMRLQGISPAISIGVSFSLTPVLHGDPARYPKDQARLMRRSLIFTTLYLFEEDVTGIEDELGASGVESRPSWRGEVGD